MREFGHDYESRRYRVRMVFINADVPVFQKNINPDDIFFLAKTEAGYSPDPTLTSCLGNYLHCFQVGM